MKVKAFLLLCALASWLTVSISLGSIFLFLVKLVLPRRLFVVLCRRVQAAYLAPFVYIIERYANVTLRQTGDALPQDESALILPNHLNQDWAPLYCLAYRCHMLGCTSSPFFQTEIENCYLSTQNNKETRQREMRRRHSVCAEEHLQVHPRFWGVNDASRFFVFET